MWRGSILGTGLGVLGAATGFLAVQVVHGLLQAGGLPTRTLSEAPFLLFIVAVVAGPGALVLSVPLQILLRRRQARSSERGTLLVLALVLGLGFGLLNLTATLLALEGPERAVDLLARDTVGLRFAFAAALGGLGLGLGCFWGLPKPKEAP